MVQLYHEPQQAALCAVHTINTLLQGPYFSEVQLALIAQQLDEEERRLLGGQSFQGANEFSNVREDGMFSSQVLFRALESIGLEPIPITNPAVQGVLQHPEVEFGFILNQHEHWYTIRKVEDNSWWNFNSLSKGPEPIGTFYLSAYLHQMQLEEWTVYVIRGEVDKAALPMPQHAGSVGRWMEPEEARQLAKQKEETKQKGLQANITETLMNMAAMGKTITNKVSGALFGPDGAPLPPQDDPDLQAAIEASLRGGGNGRSYADVAGAREVRHLGLEDEDAELERAILASLGGGAGAAGGAGPRPVPVVDLEEEEMRRAIALSLGAGAAGATGMGEVHVIDDEAAPGPSSSSLKRARDPSPPPLPVPEEPPEGAPGAITLLLRVTGKGAMRLQRRFLPQNTVGEVLRYVRAEAGVPASRMVRQFPRRVFEEGEVGGTTLGEAGIQDKEALTVE